jgi:hypothetical protein
MHNLGPSPNYFNGNLRVRPSGCRKRTAIPKSVLNRVVAENGEQTIAFVKDLYQILSG